MQQMLASVLGTQLCQVGCVPCVGCAECPGCALEIWVLATPLGVASPLPGCQQSLSRCRWCFPHPCATSGCAGCGVRGWPVPCSACLCLLLPPRPALPACRGSWDQCRLSSPRKSINLLGKHVQEEQGGLSVCGAAPGVAGSPGTVDFLSSPLPGVHQAGGRCCGQNPARAGCGAAPREPLLQISLGVLGEQEQPSVLGFILLPPSHQLLAWCCSPKPSGPGSQRAGLGRQPPLICQSCLWAASPPCSYLPRAAPQHPGVLDLSQSPAVPPAPVVFPGETGARARQGLAEPNWGGFAPLGRSCRAVPLQKVGGEPGPPILLPSVLINKAAAAVRDWG